MKARKKIRGLGVDMDNVTDFVSYSFGVAEMGPPYPASMVALYRSAFERVLGKDFIFIALHDWPPIHALEAGATKNLELSAAFGIAFGAKHYEGIVRAVDEHWPSVWQLKGNSDVKFIRTHRTTAAVAVRDIEAIQDLLESWTFEKRIPKPPSTLDPLDLVEWDDKTTQVRRDLTFFMEKVWWFAKRKLPYKRSYLFWGPPGNGKTSAIRAISKKLHTRPEVFDFTANYPAPDSAFRAFMRQADTDEEGNIIEEDLDKYEDRSFDVEYRLVVLEDIDRLFPVGGTPLTKVSLQCVLNELDGDYRESGRVVIATANHPENLDTKVLCRPGRFDRLIEFSNPKFEVARRYLTRIFSMEEKVNQALFDQAAKALEGMSFASYEKLLSTSAIEAAERTRDATADFFIEDSDVEKALEVIRKERPASAKSYENPAE